jgi:tetratricopeptide (TPR) repeat protein
VWIGDANFQRDDNEAALTAYENALSLDPDNVVLMNNLAWQYAAHPDYAFRDGKKAVEWAQRAAENTQHENTAVLDTLAAAHAENGDFDAAIKTIQTAIALATGKRQEELAKKYEQNLRLYEQGLAQP